MNAKAHNSSPDEGNAPFANFTNEQLQAAWASAFNAAPPASFSSEMLIRGLTWHAQIAAHGDVSTNTLAKLKNAAEAARQRRLSPEGEPVPVSAPARRYVRVWLGATHVVEEVDGAFIWQGQRFRSLSGAAKAITGTHWNGPLFFGLRDRSAWGHRSRGAAAATPKRAKLKATARG